MCRHDHHYDGLKPFCKKINKNNVIILNKDDNVDDQIGPDHEADMNLMTQIMQWLNRKTGCHNP